MPTQVGHTRGVPFLSPVPEQALQGAWEDIRSGTVAPSTASVKLSVTSDSMSWPRRGCVRVPVPPAVEQAAEHVTDTAAEAAGAALPARAAALGRLRRGRPGRS